MGEKKRVLRLRLAAFCLIGGMIWGSCRSLPSKLKVCQIQGGGAVSPYRGSEVNLSGTVGWVGGGLDAGFILLDDSCPSEAEGSRGLFVALKAAPGLVNPGDMVRLRGVVEEYEGETRLSAETGSLEILSLDNARPTPADLQQVYLVNPYLFSYEGWEGMLVTLPGAWLIGGEQDKQGWLAVPRFNPGVPESLSAELDRPFYLWIRSGDLHPTSRGSFSGWELRDLTGFIRQGREGYVLEVADPEALRLIAREGQEKLIPWDSTAQDHRGEHSEGQETQALEISPTPLSTKTSLPATPTAPLPTWYPVPLLISEVLPNPEGKEPEGEWVEIYNPEKYGIPLTGVKLGDEISPEGKEGMVSFPEGYYIEAGEVLVIANNAVIFRALYGFFPDFELAESDGRVPDMQPYQAWGRSNVQFSNTGDEVLLVDPWDVVIDLLAYGSSDADGFSPSVPAPPEGYTLERYPPERDRDRAEDWRERQGGSPGKLDRSPPTPPGTSALSGSLTPSSSPACSATPSPTSSQEPTRPTLLPGLDTVTWTATSTPSLPLPSSTQVPPSPTESASQTPALPPTLGPSPTASPSTTLTPDALSSPTPGSTSTWTTSPAASTATWTAELSQTRSPLPSSTFVMSATPEISRTPTPQLILTALPTHVPDPTPTGQPTLGDGLVINEIHADPHPELGDADGNGLVHSDDDEFLELVNVSPAPLDLGGWEIQDNLRTRFVFPEATWLREGCGLVVFGGEDPYTEISGSLVFGAGSLGLNNGGDTIRLLDSSGEVILELSYGLEAGRDQALTRDPDLVGALPLVPHSEIPEAEGRLFSPGTRLDGAAFGTCP